MIEISQFESLCKDPLCRSSSVKHSFFLLSVAVELRFNEPLFNELLGITNNIFRPGKSYSKMYGAEPRFNELLDLTNRFQQPKVKIYLPRYNEQSSSQVMNTVVDIVIYQGFIIVFFFLFLDETNNRSK